MTLAIVIAAACPSWQPGDSLPVALPLGCPAPAYLLAYSLDHAEADAEAAKALNACAAAGERLARAVEGAPEPVSRVEWLAIGVGIGAGLVVAWEAR